MFVLGTYFHNYVELAKPADVCPSTTELSNDKKITTSDLYRITFDIAMFSAITTSKALPKMSAYD